MKKNHYHSSAIISTHFPGMCSTKKKKTVFIVIQSSVVKILWCPSPMNPLPPDLVSERNSTTIPLLVWSEQFRATIYI